MPRSRHLSRRSPAIDPAEVEMTAIRAQGAGGQNINKVASAIHLRFDIAASSLPEDIRQRLLTRGDRRITRDGVLVIKAQRYRDRERNREDALARLQALVDSAAVAAPRRVTTRPSRASRERRLGEKRLRSHTKSLRRTPAG